MGISSHSTSADTAAVEQTRELQAVHPSVQLVRLADGRLEVIGSIGFNLELAGQRLEGSYELKMLLDKDFPKTVPVVWETKGAIDRTFGHLMSDDTLCLGAEVEILRRWKLSPQLVAFVCDEVVPYLAAHTYWLEHRTFPLGELKHGSDGILQYYCEHFGVSSTSAIWLVKLLADGYIPSQRCPCGAGRRLKDCHWAALESLRAVKSREFFESNLRGIVANRSKRTQEVIVPRRRRR